MISPAYFIFMAFVSLWAGQRIARLYVPPRYTRARKRAAIRRGARGAQ